MRLKGMTTGAALAVGLGLGGGADAQTVELSVHHFLPPTSPAQQQLIEPWARAVEEQSGGRIQVTIYPAMQLGGAPPALYDQVRDGIADVVWTLPSYTPGRFPLMSVFELPFMISDAVATAQAAQEFYETYARDEYADVHPIIFHVHARGVVHTRGKAVRTLEDFQGLQLRAPTRAIGEALTTFGAVPIFMPVPQVPEAISRGVVEGTVVPWEVTVPLRLYELVDHHTELAGPRGLYTSVFLFAMNKERYDSLPDDLKAVIDANSGLELSRRMGIAWEEVEEPGRDLAEQQGNTIYVMPEDEVERLRERSASVREAWVAEIDAEGHDGEALLEAAAALVEKYTEDGY